MLSCWVLRSLHFHALPSGLWAGWGEGGADMRSTHPEFMLISQLPTLESSDIKFVKMTHVILKLYQAYSRPLP